eukprot:479878-Pelagomonas_calceolata.AAC.1
MDVHLFWKELTRVTDLESRWSFSWLVDDLLKHFPRPFFRWSWWVFGQLLTHPGCSAEGFLGLQQLVENVSPATDQLEIRA